jgi:hypothetical protein
VGGGDYILTGIGPGALPGYGPPKEAYDLVGAINSMGC